MRQSDSHILRFGIQIAPFPHTPHPIAKNINIIIGVDSGSKISIYDSNELQKINLSR